MGTYINRGNIEFRDIVQNEYVDKSSIIPLINYTLNSENRYSCVTRCRRFGKSMAAKMLCAYYDKSCDSRELFAGLKAAADKSFDTYLNKYSVIYLDVTSFTARPELRTTIVRAIQQEIMYELKETFPDVRYKENSDLMDVLASIHNATGEKFFFIIDEWDAICREFPGRQKLKGDPETITPTILDEYVMLLRRLFKTQDSDEVFAGAYLTGILPIKKDNTESALNNFCEYSMIDPAFLASCYGFTEEEVQTLAKRYDASMESLKMWYDGYKVGRAKSIYNPYSVMKALQRGTCKSYWTTTGAYDSVITYIQMNYDGLKDDIIRMLAGERVYVNTSKFQNDMHIVRSKNDVFTVLIHLGYLAYDDDQRQCYVPNKEVADEFLNAVEDTSWTRLVDTITASQRLLDATLARNEQAVAQAIDLAHDEQTSILSYNDENSLACVLTMAYIWARNEYIIHREYATGKGYADLVMIPRSNVSKPALVIELKFNHSADTAIDQIKRKEYPSKIAEYTGDILLVGINYDKETKQHTCQIEQAVIGG
ncbi:MAG: AAA family ATPase [Parabacteroides sp.]|nr:AAA family ATPase [bacterium]MDY4102461.1 AAA family ATPase [Parabacteroides sp.]